MVLQVGVESSININGTSAATPTAHDHVVVVTARVSSKFPDKIAKEIWKALAI